MAVKDEQEWMRQADYDLKYARILLENKGYIYSVFLCHLSIEKALKALYFSRHNDQAPKVHNLLYFVNKLELDPPEEFRDFINYLNRLSIPTRYPDEIRKMYKIYSKSKTKQICEKSGRLVEWLKEQL